MPTPGTRRTRATLWAVSLAMFCVQLDYFALTLAVPDIAADFHVPTADLQWSLGGYLLAAGAFMIAAGRMADLLGRRRMLLVGISLFGLSSLLCALASSAPMLIVFRVLQGTGAAMIMPIGFALLTNAFPKDQHGRATGFAFAVAGIGTAAGPFVGGVLTEWVGWRALFLINVPMAIAAAFMTNRAVESRDDASPRVDWLGLVTVTAGIAGVTAAVDRSQEWGWASGRTLGLLAVGVALLAAFLLVEARVQHPLVDLRLFRNRPYVVLSAAGTVANVGAAIVIFVASLYLQQVRGLSPVAAGVLFLAPAAAVALAGPLAGSLSNRKPVRTMAVATAIGGLASLALSATTAVLPYVLLLSLSAGTLALGYSLTTIATQAVVRPERAGEASGVTLTAMLTAAGMGTALVGEALPSHEAPTTANLAGPLIPVAVTCFVTAGVLALSLPRLARRRPVGASSRPTADGRGERASAAGLSLGSDRHQRTRSGAHPSTASTVPQRRVPRQHHRD
ncbi:MFS transporter [Streptomyces vinaceus]|uniref:MFS transporter n=1 Tax=Streptomyces vinaceus TaxID=1960 RepID=UPI0035D97B1E